MIWTRALCFPGSSGAGQFLKPKEVILLEKLFLAYLPKTGVNDFLGENFLAGADMSHDKGAALACNLVKVNYDHLATGLKRSVDGV